MFTFDILKVSNDLEVIQEGTKEFVLVNKKTTLINWVKKNSKTPKYNKLPVFSSSFNTKNKTKNFGNSLGYCYFTANRIEYNSQFVALLTTPFSVSRGFHISENNLKKVLVAYAVRKLIINNVWNALDEYNSPNINDNRYNQFENDSFIIGLFSDKSNQCSYRNLQHMGEMYNIKNEFFWMSVEEMKQLADDNGYDNLYNDARTSPNRHVYNLLFGEERIYDKLSPDAKLVLDKASELVRKSIQARQLMSDNENHLDSWDAGYAQLKLVWKEYFSEDFKEFRQMYKNLEDRMRPLVYELGFLMK